MTDASSGTTDLMTNTLGTAVIGVVICRSSIAQQLFTKPVVAVAQKVSSSAIPDSRIVVSDLTTSSWGRKHLS